MIASFQDKKKDKAQSTILKYFKFIENYSAETIGADHYSSFQTSLVIHWYTQNFLLIHLNVTLFPENKNMLL